jgi:uncharacterized OB-fold protein
VETETPLSAPLNIDFDYTRSLGPVLSQFMTALTERRILGCRGSDGRVHVPPAEYDPVTHDPLTDLVEVSTVGTLLTWTWLSRPLEGQPLTRPFAWALILLDGADTPMLHAVDAGDPSRVHTGMRVRARWSATPVGHIRDIECFEPAGDPAATTSPLAGDPAATTSPLAGDPAATASPPAAGETAQAPAPAALVTMMTTPINLRYQHTVSPGESRYLHALAEGRLIGQRCPVCHKVYIPPRGACPTDGVPTTDEVELPDRGTVTTFCIVNVPFPGQRVPPPYVAAYVLLDGADIPIQHLILGCDAGEVRMGMRVEAVWKPREQWDTTPQNIDHFRPTGEPDAAFESYAHHL